ncbi:hypothetical protein ACFL3C_03020 [Patescibacteria group bacterium]
MNVKRLILASIVIWVVSFAFIMLTCGWLFTWVYEIPPLIWVSPEDMNLGLSIASGLLTAFLFTLVYAIFYKGIPGKGVKKGMIYGILLWLVGPLVGTLVMPVYMTIAWTVVIYWIIQMFILKLILGALVGAIYKPKK